MPVSVFAGSLLLYLVSLGLPERKRWTFLDMEIGTTPTSSEQQLADFLALELLFSALVRTVPVFGVEDS